MGIHFSFSLQEGAEGYVYYGTADNRTEFEAILDNKLINTINGVNKDVFYYIYGASPAESAMENVCAALKASEIPYISDIYYRVAGDAVEIVSKDAKGAVRLVDMLIAYEKITSPAESIKNIISQCGGQLHENKAVLEAISKNSDMALADILVKDSEDILKEAGKDMLKIGEYTISKGKGVTQVLKNGIEITVDTSRTVTREEAVAAGYVERAYNKQSVLFNNKGLVSLGTIKFIVNRLAVTITLHDAYKHFKSAAISVMMRTRSQG